MATVYDFTAKKPSGELTSLREYEGQVLLIVNTASKCGFTPQFKELQALYDKFKDRGFAVLGFPCAQFGNQEFEKTEETMEFCQVNYGVTFPMFAKVDVKGPDADPLFAYLTNEKKGLLGSTEIKWNFTKFLVGKDGRVVDRYAPQTNPAKLEDEIAALL
ncbi:MAG: glutathione peroxidase [Paenibacillus dendritiformis]|uniref:glutathione peroxidase n=1 Tax=Paenibacillus dendritiformis TaxID=130049 RepID=UPI00143DB73C|nr:glutathione peroxidase [Paenibacillus dendritiformis]MDU5145134.1 glutathione peroxidase [Paenibacillus dendritiformis]NKI21752.1 glutathione peroxidase [Paenibacillus dendritiformis]NRF99316.1 glutathione peroxidase [Paenibacillus dendritiformis]GIO75259.1 glutathione peroxidase [Paenibacillus dendritiformis]